MRSVYETVFKAGVGTGLRSGRMSGPAGARWAANYRCPLVLKNEGPGSCSGPSCVLPAMRGREPSGSPGVCLLFGIEGGDVMKSDRKLIYVVAGALLIVMGAVGYAVWRDSQTNTLEINIGDETLRIETEGR